MIERWNVEVVCPALARAYETCSSGRPWEGYFRLFWVPALWIEQLPYGGLLLQVARLRVSAAADRQLWLPGLAPPKHLDGRYTSFVYIPLQILSFSDLRRDRSVLLARIDGKQNLVRGRMQVSTHFCCMAMQLACTQWACKPAGGPSDSLSWGYKVSHWRHS